MTDYRAMTMEELRERLLETREFQRITRVQRDALDDQVVSLGFQCDDIIAALEERCAIPRLVAVGGFRV